MKRRYNILVSGCHAIMIQYYPSIVHIEWWMRRIRGMGKIMGCAESGSVYGAEA